MSDAQENVLGPCSDAICCTVWRGGGLRQRPHETIFWVVQDQERLPTGKQRQGVDATRSFEGSSAAFHPAMVAQAGLVRKSVDEVAEFGGRSLA